MYNRTKLAINFDEISDDLSEAFIVMHKLGVNHGELRTVNRKNFVSWSDVELEDFKQRINKQDINLVAAATPLFKWYASDTDAEVPHDNFGFNPRLTLGEKRRVVTRTLDIANELGITRLRIFSELRSADSQMGSFAANELLKYAIKAASTRNIDLLIENEPVCRIHTKRAIIDFLEENKSPNLKLWLDIANLMEVGEVIDEKFLSTVASRIGYIHVKNYINDNGVKRYVPAGDGEIDYASILPFVLSYCQSNVIVSVETHARHDEKVAASQASLIYLSELLNKYKGGA